MGDEVWEGIGRMKFWCFHCGKGKNNGSPKSCGFGESCEKCKSTPNPNYRKKGVCAACSHDSYNRTGMVISEPRSCLSEKIQNNFSTSQEQPITPSNAEKSHTPSTVEEALKEYFEFSDISESFQDKVSTELQNKIKELQEQNETLRNQLMETTKRLETAEQAALLATLQQQTNDATSKLLYLLGRKQKPRK